MTGLRVQENNYTCLGIANINDYYFSIKLHLFYTFLPLTKAQNFSKTALLGTADFFSIDDFRPGGHMALHINY